MEDVKETGTASLIASMRRRFDKRKETGDIQIVAGKDDTVTRAHSFILSSRSEFFDRLLSVDMREKRESTIRISDASGEVVAKMLLFFYTGEVTLSNLSKMDVFDLHQIATRYMVDSLATITSKHILDTFVKNGPDALLLLLGAQDADALGKELQDVCYKRLALDVEAALGSVDMKLIPLGVIEGLMRQDEMSIDEGKLLEIVLSWADGNCSNETERLAILPRLLQHPRASQRPAAPQEGGADNRRPVHGGGDVQRRADEEWYR
jgi:hypothetical protein